MFEGDLEEGELEIGQVAAAIREVKPAAEILREIWNEYKALKQQLCNPAQS
jgi:enoyl-[acyl-carrier protein] reductase II